MSKSKKRQTGDEGEQSACDYLESIGYKILGRNIELSIGEIDILAFDPPAGGVVVLVEVKTVKGEGYGPAKDLVRRAKQEKLRNLAGILEQKYPSRTIRIDVIGVDKSVEPPHIEHLISAVEG
ncbi:MAG: YraN family protein [Patescibacteria group bacterium]|jgi:putative endonuclease